MSVQLYCIYHCVTGGRCYKLFGTRDKTKRLNYTEAHTACKAFGPAYDVASVSSHAELGKLEIIKKCQVLCLYPLFVKLKGETLS